MADLRTTYMGIELANPVVVGACSLSKNVDVIQKIEAAGAGALVVKSLFEEQIQIERRVLDDELSRHDNMFAEAVSLFPAVEHGGPKEFLYWLKKSRKAVKMPLIASLNAVETGTWIAWAKQLADTGVDGLELNFYSPPLDTVITAGDIEESELEVLSSVVQAVKIPVAVKLHPQYTSLMNVASRFAEAGAKALVLFNRLFEPDIDVEAESQRIAPGLSRPGDTLLSVRWAALLTGRVETDIIGSGGVGSGRDAAKLILAGARAVQVVSTVYRHGMDGLGGIVGELGAWMDEQGHADIESFRGKLAQERLSDPWHYTRGQYIKGILGFD
jgi:dihydroorotate dehydrogenase (fumarate)